MPRETTQISLSEVIDKLYFTIINDYDIKTFNRELFKTKMKMKFHIGKDKNKFFSQADVNIIKNSIEKIKNYHVIEFTQYKKQLKQYLNYV